MVSYLLVRVVGVVVCGSDDEDAEVRCKENLDLAVATDPSNAETYHILASYWLCKDDRQVPYKLTYFMWSVHEIAP